MLAQQAIRDEQVRVAIGDKLDVNLDLVTFGWW